MYVTTRAARIAGRYVPAGTILPNELRVPGHLVTSGIAVQLPDTLHAWPADDVAETGSDAPAPDPEPEPEPAPEPEPVEPDEVLDGMKIEDIDVDHMHQGQGWYELPGGERVRGKENAQRAIAEQMVANAEGD